jgi:hypothetical protein
MYRLWALAAVNKIIDFWNVMLCCLMGLERGPLSLVRINEELLETKVAPPV